MLHPGNMSYWFPSTSIVDQKLNKGFSEIDTVELLSASIHKCRNVSRAHEEDTWFKEI
jgi:hypothetical protein